MNLTDSFYDDVIVVRVDGELDRATATCFSEYVGAQLSLGLRRFLVDLEGCSFMDGGGLAALFALTESIRHDGGTLAVIAPILPIRHIMEIVGLTGAGGLQVHDSLVAGPSPSPWRSLRRRLGRAPRRIPEPGVTTEDA